MTHRLKILVIIAVLALCTGHPPKQAAASTEAPSITILTDTWLPYINEQGMPSGTAAKAMDIIAKEMQMTVNWEHLPYGVSYDLIKRNKAVAAYPYFRTEQRTKEVLFSEAVFSATSRVYYNRQYTSAKQGTASYHSLKKGKVLGYSYGDSIDQEFINAKEYSTERSAIEALLKNDIQLLPMTEGVLAATMDRFFPYRIQLIKPISGIEAPSTLHLIAPDTREGKALIRKFNDGLKILKNKGLLSAISPLTDTKAQADHAVLVPSEGYPLISGMETSKDGQTQYYTLLQGTQVLVIKWSPQIMTPSKNEQAYIGLTDVSRVVVLNGPHVGKELLVKNMHIKLL